MCFCLLLLLHVPPFLCLACFPLLKSEPHTHLVTSLLHVCRWGRSPRPPPPCRGPGPVPQKSPQALEASLRFRSRPFLNFCQAAILPCPHCNVHMDLSLEIFRLPSFCGSFAPASEWTEHASAGICVTTSGHAETKGHSSRLHTNSARS